MSPKNTIAALEQLLSPYDSSLTECDGMTQICHTLLCREGIPHQTYVGVCRYNGNLLPLHFWIDLTEQLQGWRVDYRLRMWFGELAQIPHGIFLPEDFSEVEYKGICVDPEPLPEVVFYALAMGLSDMESLPWDAMKKAVTTIKH